MPSSSAPASPAFLDAGVNERALDDGAEAEHRAALNVPAGNIPLGYISQNIGYDGRYGEIKGRHRQFKSCLGGGVDFETTHQAGRRRLASRI